MKTVDLTNPIFTNPDKARQHFASIRWPNGPYCSYCGVPGGPHSRAGRQVHGTRAGITVKTADGSSRLRSARSTSGRISL